MKKVRTPGKVKLSTSGMATKSVKINPSLKTKKPRAVKKKSIGPGTTFADYSLDYMTLL